MSVRTAELGSTVRTARCRSAGSASFSERPGRACTGRRRLRLRTLVLMRQIDELLTAWPFLPSRRMSRMLRGDGRAVNRTRVQRLLERVHPFDLAQRELELRRDAKRDRPVATRAAPQTFTDNR